MHLADCETRADATLGDLFMQTSNSLLLEHLQALEVELHKPATRADAARLVALLHEAFKEFGRSGRTYTKAEILSSLPTDVQHSTVVADHFEMASLDAEVALLTYRSADLLADGTLDRFSMRASVWQFSDLGWQMRFHQGTPTSTFEPEHISGAKGSLMR